jgi:hypothetical protein
MSYIPFSDAWRKEYMKHAKAYIISKLKFKADPSLPKARLIELLRVELIVEQFNKDYKVGDKVRWRSVKDDSFPYHEYTTLTVAYIAQNGLPCVHFREKSGYCCVEPEFIETVNVEPGTSEEEKYETAMKEIQAELDKLVGNM